MKGNKLQVNQLSDSHDLISSLDTLVSYANYIKTSFTKKV